MAKKVIVESNVKDGMLEKLLPFLEKNLPNARGFSGCLNVTIFLNKESGNMVFDEEWLTVDHHRAYIKFIEEHGVMEELGSFLESPPEIKYFDCMSI